MTKKELTKLDKLLDKSNEKDNILINKKGYFIYYNEPNKKTKEIKIHTYNCGFCAWGSGRDSTKQVGRNGVWIGPFKTVIQAKYFINNVINQEKYSHHMCIK